MKPSCMKKHIISIGIPLLIIGSVVESLALPPATHKAINSYISDEKLSAYGEHIDKYLKDYLGLTEGVKTSVNSKMVKEWIADGGEQEDSWGVRSMNHFHNPLTDEGLVGYESSAIKWATLPVGQQNLAPLSSWNDVRYYYERALTEKEKKSREEWFARTFQGVGQLMHLVEDMSVPAGYTENQEQKQTSRQEVLI